MPESSQAMRVLRFDTFELDVRAGELRKRGRKLPLEGQPLQVLAILIERSGDLVTRDELRSQIWHADTFVDFDHSLHNAVARLRKALGDSVGSPRYIETLPRRGYRFIAPVEEGPPTRLGLQPGHLIPKSDQSGIRAVAVLPLHDLSGKPHEDYFADGMTEALITSLAKINALRVISRTSVMQYKRTRKSLPRIARELNVDLVIEGSVLRAGKRIRITTQLIQANSDQHLWAESYERDAHDILALQSEIAREVAHNVKIILTPEEKARLRSAPQVNPEAHELYLKARYYWNKRSAEGVRKALAYFQRALDQDPTYAQAYAGMADCYNILGYYNVLPPIEAYPKGKAAASKALSLDSSLAEPHAALGVVKRDFEWDWPGAAREFERAAKLDPGYVETYHWRATLHSILGHHTEAIQEKTRALSLDPLSVVIKTDLARVLYFARDYDRSIEQYREALDMDPNFATAHLWLAHSYEQKNLLREAISELETVTDRAGESSFVLGKLGHGYAVAGKHKQARTILQQLHALSPQTYVSPYDIAMVHLGLHEHEDALKWLREAFEQRSLWLGYINVEPQLDELRSDHRFQDLLRRIGFN